MTNLEILIEARALIADKSHWTHEVFANTSNGIPVLPNSHRATKWCAIGALRKIVGDDSNSLHGIDSPIRQLNLVALDLYQMNIANVNDRLGHQSVLKVYDLAIKTSGEKE